YAITNITSDEKPNWKDYAWFVISGIYIISYFYQKSEKYLTIENGIIKQNWPFGKELNLTEIKGIKHFAGDYILKSDKKQLKINAQLIDEKSLSALKTELEKLNAEWY
ncbi:MAG: hypothetical protein R6V74_00755, partial [Lutibacter sp.]